ncbi:MAG: hypothetical protein R8M70_00425 [Alphaproteobacteria bacterium]|nr:hypothetical protein [Alphaproteobacteria bacterium]
MKRFVAVLSGLLVLPAFAEVAPVYYDELIEYSGDTAPAEEATETVTKTVASSVPATVSANNLRTVNRNISRATPAAAATKTGATRSASGRTAVTNRSAANGAVVARTAATARTATPSRVSARAVRTAANGSQQIATARRAMQGDQGKTTTRTSIVQTDTVNTPLYTGRVATRASAVRARIPALASIAASTDTSTAVTTQSLDELAQVTDFCKAQYMSCMDNFCNVLDDNQGRCSCSKNIKNYAKTEEALKAATEALQDVAQQIRYIGLSADDIETLFTQTEAEMQMQSSQDNTQLKNDLDRIKNLIVDVKTGSASAVTDSAMGFDLSGLLDFNIDSTGFDLTTLFGSSSANTSSISNQRGEALYKTAAARCKVAVLNDCAAQGVDIAVISNSYDLEIDKQCVAYERELSDANDQMSNTVRNAKSVLQRARLLVAQDKNSYDLRGCINALDSCMQDDYVCGADYEYCLDPTGKYIIDGEIVVGSTPGYVPAETETTIPGPEALRNKDTLYGTWYYDSDKYAWADSRDGGTLTAYITKTLSEVDLEEPDDNAHIMTDFLLHKIGYNENGKNYGMCISVLNKCQDYTYQGPLNARKYNPQNDVIKEYLQRTLVKIKSAQDQVITDYAENCISDVTSCLTSNNYVQGNELRNNVAINACRAQIMTCMSVNGDITSTPTPTQIQTWVANMLAAYGETNDTGASDSDSSNDNTNDTGSSGQGSSTGSTTTGTQSSCAYCCNLYNGQLFRDDEGNELCTNTNPANMCDDFCSTQQSSQTTSD